MTASVDEYKYVRFRKNPFYEIDIKERVDIPPTAQSEIPQARPP